MRRKEIFKRLREVGWWIEMNGRTRNILWLWNSEGGYPEAWDGKLVSLAKRGLVIDSEVLDIVLSDLRKENRKEGNILRNLKNKKYGIR